MGVVFQFVEIVLLLQAFEHDWSRLKYAPAGECSEPVAIDPIVVERRDRRHTVELRQFVILGPASRRDVQHPSPLLLTHLVPKNDLVRRPLLHRQVVERPVVG